jgi:hypothetical protein
MLLNGSKIFRKPSIIDDTEFNNLVSWVLSMMESYVLRGHTSFTAKDLFGYTHYDWSSRKYPIQILFYRWREKYEKENPGLSPDVLTAKAFDAAGVSLGYVMKKAADQSQRRFKTYQEFRLTRYVLQ